MPLETIKIAAVYFNKEKKSGEPYYDTYSKSNYTLVTIYEAGKQRDGRKLYGKEFAYESILHNLKKGDSIELKTEQGKNGMWGFQLPSTSARFATKPSISEAKAPYASIGTIDEAMKVLAQINEKLDYLVSLQKGAVREQLLSDIPQEYLDKKF